MPSLHHRLAKALAFVTPVLVFAGGLVTSTQSGLAVPDWPLSYGRIILPMKGGILFEHGHRLFAAAVGLLTIAVAASFQWKEPRAWLRRAAWGALGLVVLQGVFGGLTVLFKLQKPVLSIIHACVAQSFFCLTVALALWSSPAWEAAAPRREENPRRTPLHLLTLFLFGILFIQLVFGAVIRHTGLGVLPHVLNPLIILLLVGATTSRAVSDPGAAPVLNKALWLLPAVYLVQVTLGVLTLLLVSAGPPLRWPRVPGLAVITAHVAVGAVFMGAAVAAALLAYRTRPAGAGSFRRVAGDYMTLMKPGISVMNVVTALAGYWLGARGSADLAVACWLALGTLLVAGGAGTLNMWRERDIDARMLRTEKRPLPARRLAPAEALAWGIVLSAGGAAGLAAMVNAPTALLSLLTLAVYIFLYTPLKARSPWNTAVGAVAGAVPPVMGWMAAGRDLGPEAWVLFAILFFWQFPHFYALAWMYRDDYARAGLFMLPVVEPDGDSTARKMVTHSFALLAASLLPAFFGLTGRVVYPLGAMLLGVVLLSAGWRFFQDHSHDRARTLFLASVTYLPLLLILLVLDRP
jgi:heme o synthase